MSSDLRTVAPTSLYESDYALWVESTVEKLRGQHYDEVDWENLIDEVEDMAKRDRRALKSNLVVVLLHLLKWAYQPEQRSGSWQSSIEEHRRRIDDILEDSPSLKPYISSALKKSYRSARIQTSAETGLPIAVFPENCPYEIAQVLSSDFLPESNR